MRPTSPKRGLPTSRAYWELKAEQMMNRVFDPEATIDLDTLSGDPPPSLPHRPLPLLPAPGPRVVSTAAPGPGSVDQTSKGTSSLSVFLLAALGGVGLVGAISAMLLVQQWAGLQRTLSQERNLLLVERLRTLGPATAPAVASTTPPAPVLDPVPSAVSPPLAAAADLPPPPPEEPWMEQLAALPPNQTSPLLRVPVTPTLTSAAPAASAGGTPRGAVRPSPPLPPKTRSSTPLPQLVGLVGAPGRAGSAIFQVGDTSTNVSVGEQIGSSGWRLSAADGESALIERGSEVRRIAIVTGG